MSGDLHLMNAAINPPISGHDPIPLAEAKKKRPQCAATERIACEVVVSNDFKRPTQCGLRHVLVSELPNVRKCPIHLAAQH